MNFFPGCSIVMFHISIFMNPGLFDSKSLFAAIALGSSVSAYARGKNSCIESASFLLLTHTFVLRNGKLGKIMITLTLFILIYVCSCVDMKFCDSRLLMPINING